MTFPNGPYGQGFQHQPSWPQQPGFPQPGFPQLSTPGPQPSGATGIAAAILALLGGLVGIAGCVGGVIGLINVLDKGGGATVAALTAGIAVGVIDTLLLLIGSVNLFKRKMIGRTLVVAGCILAIVGGLVGVGGALHGGTPEPALIAVAFVIPAIVTLVLAVLPSTARWIRAGRESAAQHPISKPQPIHPPVPLAPTSGAAAKSAAVHTGLLGVIVFGVMLAGVIDALVSSRTDVAGTVISALILSSYGLLLLVGAVKLFHRKRAGRWMAITGCVLATVVVTIGAAATYTDATRDGQYLPFVALNLVGVATLAAIVLAMLPSTGRWIRAGQIPAVPQPIPPHALPPAQGYPPHYG